MMESDVPGIRPCEALQCPTLHIQPDESVESKDMIDAVLVIGHTLLNLLLHY